MNWLGLSWRSLVGILLGVVAGALLFLYLTPSVLLVGATTGVGCALLAEDRSFLRGVSVLTVATWTAAVLDARRLGISTFAISSALRGQHLLAYVGTLIAAFVIGASSIRRGAGTRTAGT